MSENLPYDPDFEKKASSGSSSVQVTLSKEQIVAIGVGMGAVAGLVYLALLKWA
ncbi:MAG: hypothetical protein WCJ29_03350 [bacterium]